MIGITGKAGSGKDYTYRKLVEAFPTRKFANHKFSDLVKWDIEDAIANNDWEPLEHLWRKPYSPEVRALLQWWGTDLRRRESQDYWVNKMHAQMMDAISMGTIRVVTDVRYANEVKLILDLGGLIIRTYAEKDVRAKRLNMTREELDLMSRHESEQEMPPSWVDHHVYSNSEQDWEASGIVEKVKDFINYA